MTIEQAHKDGIASAHTRFEQLTGKQYQLHSARMFAWEKFLVRRRFNEEDLTVVVRYLQKEIAAGKTFPPVLWFNNLIEAPDKFEEYLNDAKAKARNAIVPKTDKDFVLEAVGRTIQRKKDISVISMNERVRWHLDNMRKTINDKTKS